MSHADQQQATWQDAGTIVEAGDAQAAQDFFDALPPGESARVLDQLEPQQRADLVALLPESDAAHLMEVLPDVQAAAVIEQLPIERAAAIVDHMESAGRVDLLEQINEELTTAILAQMAPEQAENVRFLAHYEPETAGGLMITEFLKFDEALAVGDVLRDLRENAERYSEYDVQYAYVVSKDDKLQGVLRLRDLLLSPQSRRLESLMITRPISVLDTTPLSELRHTFDRHPLFGLPVIDQDGRLMGVVKRADVEEAGEEQAGRTFLKFAGILGGEELRSMPLHSRCARRLSWLSINIVLNVIAASVIAMYQDTLRAVIALAVFLPIVSDMSGCSGNQAVAVSMRELTLGIIRPTDFLRVFRKEALLGIANGLALGILLGSVGLLWKGNFALGLVVGGALAVNTLVAVCLGSLIPLALRGIRLDPALASGPLLTTITDMCGFFLVLSFANLMLPYLTA